MKLIGILEADGERSNFYADDVNIGHDSSVAMPLITVHHDVTKVFTENKKGMIDGQVCITYQQHEIPESEAKRLNIIE